jgi:phosphate uptake regulator
MFVQRKLIKQGKDGFTIYLPKQWVIRKGMSAGDVVDVQEIEEGILISGSMKASLAIEIDLREYETSRSGLELLLSHLYRLGFATMRLTGCDDQTARTLRELTDKLLLGFEMTSRTKGACVIENVSEPTEAKYDVVLRRMFLLIKETQSRLLSDALGGAYDEREIEHLRNQVDRYAFFCMRVNALQLRSETSIAAWEMLKDLVTLEHSHARLYSYMAKHHMRAQPVIAKLLTELQGLFTAFYEAYWLKNATSSSSDRTARALSLPRVWQSSRD